MYSSMFVFPSHFSMSQIFFHSFPEHSVSIILLIKLSFTYIIQTVAHYIILLYAHILIEFICIPMYLNVIYCCIWTYGNTVSIMEAWKDMENVGTWCNCIGVCQYCGSFLATNISMQQRAEEVHIGLEVLKIMQFYIKELPLLASTSPAAFLITCTIFQFLA